MSTTLPGIPYEPDIAPAATTGRYRMNVVVRPDPRDIIDPDENKVGLTPLPPMAMNPNPAPIIDQGQLGSCTANGLAGMYYTELLRQGVDPVWLSRLAWYYGEREMERDIPEDAGADPRDGLNYAKKHGVGREDLWPYDIRRFTEKPPQAVLDDAKNHRLSAYYRVVSLSNMKRHLFENATVGIAWDVYDGAERTRNGVIPMPGVGEQPLGGHWTYLNGYCDRPDWPGGGYFRMPNSWSAGWGDHGNGYIPYAYVLNSQLTMAKWRMVLPKLGG